MDRVTAFCSPTELQAPNYAPPFERKSGQAVIETLDRLMLATRIRYFCRTSLYSRQLDTFIARVCIAVSLILLSHEFVYNGQLDTFVARVYIASVSFLVYLSCVSLANKM